MRDIYIEYIIWSRYIFSAISSDVLDNEPYQGDFIVYDVFCPRYSDSLVDNITNA